MDRGRSPSKTTGGVSAATSNGGLGTTPLSSMSAVAISSPLDRGLGCPGWAISGFLYPGGPSAFALRCCPIVGFILGGGWITLAFFPSSPYHLDGPKQQISDTYMSSHQRETPAQGFISKQ